MSETASPPEAVTGLPLKGIVVVAHGGQEVSTKPTTAVQPAVLRMVPIARAIGNALSDAEIRVLRPRTYMPYVKAEAMRLLGEKFGWQAYAQKHFESRFTKFVEGWSMGARAALRAAGHPSVRAVAALAPWVPPGEPVAQLSGRRVLLAHGDRDKITRPRDTWAIAERAREVTQVTAIEVRADGHAMLRRARLWHTLAAEFARASFGVAAGEERLAAAFRDTGPGRVTV
jgi:pimeloyl-ACP methyl ester carboxylesterase